MTDIKKKICDNCKKETDRKGMYLTIEQSEARAYFKIILKHLAGTRQFTYGQLDFCSNECITKFLEKLLMS